MSGTVFEFIDLTLDDIVSYEKNSPIFNATDDSIRKEKIILTSFHDEKLGSSVESLDVALYKDGKWCILDIEDMIDGYNEIPIGYVIGDNEYERVMVIIRRMSSMVLDKEKFGATSYVYFKMPDVYRHLENDKSLIGKLAKYRVVLDGSDEMFCKLNDMGIKVNGI